MTYYSFRAECLLDAMDFLTKICAIEDGDEGGLCCGAKLASNP